MSQMRGENDEKKITRVVLRGENHIQKESSQKGKKNIHQGSFNYVCRWALRLHLGVGGWGEGGLRRCEVLWGCPPWFTPRPLQRHNRPRCEDFSADLCSLNAPNTGSIYSIYYLLYLEAAEIKRLRRSLLISVICQVGLCAVFSPLFFFKPGDWIFTVFSFMEVSHQLTIGTFSGPCWHVHKCSAFKASRPSHHSDVFAMDGLFLPSSPSSRHAHKLTLAFSLGSLFVPYDWLCSSLDTTHRNSAWSSFP